LVGFDDLENMLDGLKNCDFSEKYHFPLFNKGNFLRIEINEMKTANRASFLKSVKIESVFCGIFSLTAAMR